MYINLKYYNAAILQVAFLSHNTEVTVEAVENAEHVHKKDDDYDKTNSKYCPVHSYYCIWSITNN